MNLKPRLTEIPLDADVKLWLRGGRVIEGRMIEWEHDCNVIGLAQGNYPNARYLDIDAADVVAVTWNSED